MPLDLLKRVRFDVCMGGFYVNYLNQEPMLVGFNLIIVSTHFTFVITFYPALMDQYSSIDTRICSSQGRVNRKNILVFITKLRFQI
jgi:hypothetical protein